MTACEYKELHFFFYVMLNNVPVPIQQWLGQTLCAGLVEPLTAASALQHLQVPPAIRENGETLTTPTKMSASNIGHLTGLR